MITISSRPCRDPGWCAGHAARAAASSPRGARGAADRLPARRAVPSRGGRPQPGGWHAARPRRRRAARAPRPPGRGGAHLRPIRRGGARQAPAGAAAGGRHALSDVAPGAPDRGRQRGDADRAAALVIALDRPDAAELVASTARSLHPALPIVARAHDPAGRDLLTRLGVQEVALEALALSIGLGEAALSRTGVDEPARRGPPRRYAGNARAQAAEARPGLRHRAFISLPRWPSCRPRSLQGLSWSVRCQG